MGGGGDRKPVYGLEADASSASCRESGEAQAHLSLALVGGGRGGDKLELALALSCCCCCCIYLSSPLLSDNAFLTGTFEHLTRFFLSLSEAPLNQSVSVRPERFDIVFFVIKHFAPCPFVRML